MRTDKTRLKGYLLEIKKNSDELQTLIKQNQLAPDSIALKAAKYLLIELAEAMSSVLQHLLARGKGRAVSGYIETVVKANELGIITDDLFSKMKPFFDFRNSLIHRYWIIDDSLLIENLLKGCRDFEQFADEIESYVEKEG